LIDLSLSELPRASAILRTCLLLRLRPGRSSTLRRHCRRRLHLRHPTLYRLAGHTSVRTIHIDRGHDHCLRLHVGAPKSRLDIQSRSQLFASHHDHSPGAALSDLITRYRVDWTVMNIFSASLSHKHEGGPYARLRIFAAPCDQSRDGAAQRLGAVDVRMRDRRWRPRRISS
jgi:hypothetical protein